MNKYLFETDYSADILRWIKKLDEKQLKKNPYSKDPSGYNPEDLEKFQNDIIAESDTSAAFFFAMEFGYKSHRMQKLILDKKDPKYAFMFAQSVKNADVRALQNIVVDSKKIKYISKFACFVKSADQKQLEPLILKSKNVKYVHMYLKHVKNANVDKMKEVILSSKKPRYLFELAKHTKNLKDLAVIEDLIIEASSFTYMRLMAEKIKLANVEKLEQAVLDTENSAEIKKFAKYVRRSKMKQFLLMV